jgi:hypothetical protein
MTSADLRDPDTPNKTTGTSFLPPHGGSEPQPPRISRLNRDDVQILSQANFDFLGPHDPDRTNCVDLDTSLIAEELDAIVFRRISGILGFTPRFICPLVIVAEPVVDCSRGIKKRA